jgi:RsiW-degrading membrane proteinase PrsW (M82 family)
VRYFFLLLGLLLIAAGGVILFVRPGQPTPIEVFAFQFIFGGFILLGIAQILKALAAGSPRA